MNKTKVRFFNPGLEYIKLKPEIDKEMQRVLKAGDLILRKDVEAFEQNLAAYVGTKYAVGLNSCTDALYIALRALHIGVGDEVLVPSRTFVASVQTIVQVGATPIFYDLDTNIEDLITETTKAIVPVHIEGAWDSHFGDVLDLAEEYDLYVIEDAAQALGATYDSTVKLGAYGDVGCFSFYPAKILGAFGDAGALVTNSEQVYRYAKDCRNHFKDDARDWGLNSRLDNLQAAILNVKMKYLPETLERRKEIAEMYHEGLQDVHDITLPLQGNGRVWQDYIINIRKRDELFEFLKEKGIETMKNNYPFPVPKLPLAQEYENKTLRLPCNGLLEDSEIEEVIIAIREFYADKL